MSGVRISPPRPDFAARFRAGAAAGRAAVRRNRARSSNWIEHQPSKLGVVGSTPAGRAMVSSALPAFAGRPKAVSNERNFPMIDLYTWPTPNGHKIHIMLEETGLKYEIHAIDIGAGDQFKPEFLAISPNNKIPAMVDQQGPDGKRFALAESGAMLFYL